MKKGIDIIKQVKEAKFEIKFAKGEVDGVIGGPGGLAPYIQSELDSEKIRAKVKSTGDEFILQFNTNIPKRKMLKILEDELGYTILTAQNESKKLVKEKLGKSADAGDYIDDFKKSDAPQFKGKSDKKKEKMAVAAYLDSKEEVKEAVAQNDAFVVTGGPGDNAQKVIAVFKDKGNGLKDAKKARDDYDKKNKPTKKSHFARIYRQTRLSQAGQRLKPGEKIMYSTFGNKQQFTKVKEEVDLEEALKIKYALVDTSKNNEVIGTSTDVTDIKHMLKRSNKGSLKIVKLKRPVDAGGKKAGLMIGYPLKEEIEIQESGHTDVASMKTQVQIATDALQKMNTELGKLSDEEDLPTWWTNKVATAVSKLDGMADYIDAKSDQGETMTEEYKSLNESAIGCLQAAMIDNNRSLKEETVFVVRFEKEGMRFAVPFRDMKMAKDGEKILKKSAGVSGLSVTKDILKPGIKLSKVKEGKIMKESKMGELFLDMQMDAQEMDEREFIKVYTKKGFQAAELKSLYKEFSEEVIKEADLKMKDQQFDGDKEQKDFFKFMKSKFKLSLKGKIEPGNTGGHTGAGSNFTLSGSDTNIQKYLRYLDDGGDLYLQIYKKKGNVYTGEEVVKEVVDNSLMAQATRVISKTAIQEKIDPADVDNIATADDRKAADKNIIIQLRRAQDMKGKADVTFKDNPKKKEKIDIKVINKVLDMFDSLRPNDKAKMQTTIGKSYRDLLKTVQRGR